MAPLYEAEIVAVTGVVTMEFVTLKVVVVAPEPITTETGTVTNFESQLNLTVAPLVPAGPVRVTVPVEIVPPVVEAGSMVTPCKLTGIKDKFAVLDIPNTVAVIVADELAET